MAEDRHKYKPLRVRPREPDRLWLAEHSVASGRAVNAIVSDAIAAYRASLSGPTTVEPSGPTASSGGPTTEKREPQRARAQEPPAAPPAVAADLEPEPEPERKPRNCKHSNMRIRKGVCPDCGSWVSGGR